MISPLRYGILCEDKAHRNFIHHYLTQCYPNQFQESDEFGWRIYASNSKEVDDSVIDAARLGFTKFGLDVLIVGRDADTTDEKRIKMLLSTLHQSCGPHHSKVMLMVPIQFVEHWLLYIKRHQENPASSKNESLETITRPEGKKLVYGGVKKTDKQVEIASQLLNSFDADWLEQHSDSFKHFHNQMKVFVKN